MTALEERPAVAGAWFGPRRFVTVLDALGALDHVEALAILFEELALAGASVPEIVATAAHVATERLPRGMSLTDARPGCWESACFEPMIPESAVLAGPTAQPLEVECPECWSAAGEPCTRDRTRTRSGVAQWTSMHDRREVHQARVDASRRAYYVPGSGWTW